VLPGVHDDDGQGEHRGLGERDGEHGHLPADRPPPGEHDLRLLLSEPPFLLAGIEAAHRAGSVKSFGTFGGGNPDLELQVAGPGRGIIMRDIFGDPTWTGYELLYQTALVLSHQQPKPLNHFYTPNRLATPQNAESIIKTGGFGTAFVNGYRHLFGLPPLKGAALANAALAQEATRLLDPG
jgi:hypothetical protein